MAKRLDPNLSAVGGIGDSLKSGQDYSYAFGRALDIRTDPSQVTINPRTVQQAAGIVQDLPMWFELACDTDLYAYGNTGSLYRKTPADVWSLEHIAPDSVGNGLCYFPEDRYLYYAQNTTIGRKIDPCGTGTYYDGFLESEGGEPTNQQSITFVQASSQYASIADNASLSITDDISLESYIKFTTLPGSNEIQTLVSKWNENSNQRSYKFDVTTVSNFFGDGRDSSLSISSNTTEDPIDANCTGTAGQYTLTLTNAHASFASVVDGDKVLIHQTRGTNAGAEQVATVQGYSGGVLTLKEALTLSPAHSATTSDANKAQIRVIKQHTTISISAGVTYSCKAWDGLKGGILAFFANTSYVNLGTVTSTEKGFRGGSGVASTNVNGVSGYQGEGTAGLGIQSYLPNGNGGGGDQMASDGSSYTTTGGGAGGSNATAGNPGVETTQPQSSITSVPGLVVGDANQTTFNLGGGGGGGTRNTAGNVTIGGRGGGIIWFAAATATPGTMTANGGQSNPAASDSDMYEASGSGAGGCIKGYFNTATLGSAITATGAPLSPPAPSHTNFGSGGAGGNGYITFYYSGSYTGTTSPTAQFILDSTLSNTNGYILRLLLSSDGANSEVYSTDITNLVSVDQWLRWQVTWDAPTSTANFYANGTLLSTQVGTFTSIYNSTARFAIGASYDSSGNATNFLDAEMDDTRVWNDVRSPLELVFYNDKVLPGTDANLCAYYKFEGNVNDSQTYTSTSNLTATNTPTYSTDVPFSGVTTRADQDIANDTSGSTYTLTTAISEAAADRYTFVPTKEPIKSVQLKIGTIGTGDWTVVIHDGLNRSVASMTVANAQLHTGYYEFVFSSSFRPILSATYHVHVYSTVADGTIVTSNSATMANAGTNTGANFATFYQILVDDIYHPMTQFLNFVAIGNERYVATLEAGNIYNPHKLTLPAGYRVRCFEKWNEFLAIGVWKGDSITDTDQGKIFLWDGSSDTSGTANPNTIINVLEGGINSMCSAGGILYAVAGYEGKLLAYAGGETQKITQIPLLSKNEYCEIAPGAMTMWRSILRFGATINTNSATVHQGIYGYGKLNTSYPNSLGFDHPLSLGDQQSSAVKVGSIYPAGQSLYAGWQSGNSYGIDKISVTNDCYPSATVEYLIQDYKRISQKKLPLVFRADFEPLTTGQSFVLKYRADRETVWKTLVTEDTVGAAEVRGVIHEQLKEIQCAVDMYSTSGESPVLIQSVLETENQSESIPA